LGAPGLRGVFDQLETVVSADFRESVPVGALSIEVDGQDGFRICGCGRVEGAPDRVRIEVECEGVDVSQDGLRAGPQDGAYRCEEAERGGQDGIAGADLCGSEGQPQGICAGRAPDCVLYVELRGGGALK